ncbi:MAG TPA: PQQ-binding-like beta-propeller repeat protein [Candidatus Thermoplasmatota archaeon]|nr:PQQ-binding-like beta-propeller repeat protein [Candidatus Thermoplasmatota archaeon]
MPSAKAILVAAAVAFLTLASGCFAPEGGLPGGGGGGEGAETEWRFAQGSVDGRRASQDPGVTLASLPGFTQAWEARTKGAVTGTPTVAEGRVYVGTWKGVVYCLSAKDGSEVWSHDLGAQVDASVTLAQGLALVGDSAGRLHALDWDTGEERWNVLVDTSLHTHLYATPLVVPERAGRPAFVVQAVGSDQESARIHGEAPLDFRGHVDALGLSDGKPIWRAELAKGGETGTPVWGTPVYDASTDRVVFGTGNAYTKPAGELTDSIMALAAADGAVAWHYQATKGDVFTQTNPDSPDHDFGSTPVLFTAGGRTLAGLGQKSSIFWAVDVATGSLAWRSGSTHSGEGIIGDGALMGDALVVPYVSLEKVAALSAADGTVRWERGLAGRGYSDPVAVAGGAIVADSGGRVHGLEAAGGREVWNVTVGEGAGVYGGLSVAEGTLFVPVVRGGFLAETGGVVAFRAGGAGTGTSTSATSAARDGVAMVGFQFDPRVVHVKAGGSVTWRNEDPVLHTVTFVDGSFDRDVEEGASVTHRFGAKGTFQYYCKPHATQTADGSWQGMTGTVIVDP